MPGDKDKVQQCTKCKKMIIGSCITLPDNDRIYHAGCFSCEKCKKVLGSGGYFEKNGKNYCEADYNNEFLPKCFKCKQPLVGQITEMLGNKYHKTCVNCSECKEALTGRFYQKNGAPICEKCQKVHAPPCVKCKELVIGKRTSVGGKTFHPDCLKCTKCNKPFVREQLSFHGDDVYHFECYKQDFGKVCVQCGGYIDGQFYEFDGKEIHSQCLDAFKKAM